MHVKTEIIASQQSETVHVAGGASSNMKTRPGSFHAGPPFATVYLPGCGMLHSGCLSGLLPDGRIGSCVPSDRRCRGAGGQSEVASPKTWGGGRKSDKQRHCKWPGTHKEQLPRYQVGSNGVMALHDCNVEGPKEYCM